MDRLRLLPGVVSSLFLVSSGLALAGCADPASSVVVLANVVPNDDCSIPAEEGSLTRGAGTFDVDVGVPYLVTPILRNGTVGNQTNPNLRLFMVKGADIELKPTTSQASVDVINALATDRFRTSFFSQTVEPDGGIASVGFPGIAADQTATLRGLLGTGGVTVLVSFRIFGDMDGSEISTPDFDFPVTVCNGCIADPMPDPDETVCPSANNQS